jgi:hypothetical protein
LNIGDGNDLQIYHNSSEGSVIRKDFNGDGNLEIRSNTFLLRKDSNSERHLYAISNAQVELYYNGSKKFETTGVGVTVFGTLETQQLNVTGVSTFEQDFGLITEVVNDSPDNGLVSDAATSFGYDLGFIVVTGLIYPTQFVLPSFSVSSLPSVNPAGQMLFVTDETGGAVPAFSDGTNWRRVTDRQIVS